MNRSVKGILFGAIAGVIDVIPMIIQKLTWDANLSALSMWIIIGYFLTKIEMRVPAFFKGIIVSFLILIPTAIIIGWQEPISILPIGIMTIILGCFLGLAVEKIAK